MDLTELALNKKIKDIAYKVVLDTQQTNFTNRNLTDTPTDALSVVNRQYVTMNGVSSNRPTSSIVGQSYFDTSLASGRGKPVWWNGTGFVDGTGTYV